MQFKCCTPDLHQHLAILNLLVNTIIGLENHSSKHFKGPHGQPLPSI